MHLSLNNSLGKWILPKEPSPFSPEATNYFSRLDAAGDTTYVDYKQPLANYIDSLVSLGGAYWDTMLSATSFVGVGIQGVTVPLRDGMAVPTNNNFVASDLNPLTGLKGAVTKELATGILDNQLTDSNASASVYATEAATAGSHLSNFFGNGGVNLRVGSPTYVALRGLSTNTSIVTAGVTGLIGLTRNTDTDLDGRASQTNLSVANAGSIPANSEIFVLSRNAAHHADSRLATYHIGPALDLATLEGLQATLLSEIRTAHTFVAAASYFSRLAAAGDTTHVAYKQPLTNYITSLVELGGAYWDDMKSAASFVGVGIQGVTVPLKSTMPTLTNNNFVAGDLDPLTGLLGDGSTKYLATGLTGTDLSKDDHSFSLYASSASTAGFAGGTYSTNFTRPIAIAIAPSTTNFYSTGPLDASLKTTSTPTLIGLSRSASTEYTARTNQGDETLTRTSGTPNTGGLSLFAVGAGVAPTASRLATYHAGPALNLATLEGLQDTLLAEIAGIGFSTEAANYFSRLVDAGDTTFLAYRQPLANYIDSLVELGGAYWDNMLSATSFVGVGIEGITVPLRDGMTVPTQSNFVSSDLDQLTGLKGDALTKDINTGLLSNDIAQNDGSLSVYQTAAVTSGNYTAGSGYNGGIGGGVFLRDLGFTIQCAVHGGLVSNGTGWVSGLVGGSRSSSTTQTQRTNQTDYPFASTSLSPTTDVFRVFAAGSSPKVDARLATYHAGPALNLATLEGLQATLITEIAAI